MFEREIITVPAIWISAWPVVTVALAVVASQARLPASSATTAGTSSPISAPACTDPWTLGEIPGPAQAILECRLRIPLPNPIQLHGESCAPAWSREARHHRVIRQPPCLAEPGAGEMRFRQARPHRQISLAHPKRAQSAYLVKGAKEKMGVFIDPRPFSSRNCSSSDWRRFIEARTTTHESGQLHQLRPISET